jgi:hypothetical protein
MPAMRCKRFAAGLGAILVWAAAAAQKPEATPAAPASSRSRHVEIDGRAEVMTTPRRTVSKTGRKMLEFDVEISFYLLAPAQPLDSDRGTQVDMTGPVRVVHDTACGGELSLRVGDKVELRGEYVEMPDGMDRVLFTHAPDAAGCGDNEHPAGYLREIVPPTPTAKATPPRPSDIVPDQPYRGTPVPSEKAYLEILRLKQAGASDEKLLEKIRSEKKAYPMTLDEMQKLKDAGVSTAVIEAMLQSGRRVIAPGRTPAPTATPGS